MQCAILVGGLGTRLGKLTKNCPKPLLNVAGVPFLEHLIRNIERHGFNDFLLLAGYRANLVRSFAKHLDLNVRIRVIEEVEPAGTAGALNYVRDLLDPEFLMLNGDSFLDIDYLDLKALKTTDDTIGKLALRHVRDGSRYGTVKLSTDGKISQWQEKTGSSGPALINGGVYWLQREILNHVPRGHVSLENYVFPKLVNSKKLVGKEYCGAFIDIGVPAEYERAQTFFSIQRY